MEQGRSRRRWISRALAAGAATGIVVGSLSLGNTAYAVVLPSTPPATAHQPAVDTELNASSNTYLNTVVEARAESRAKALASMDQQADLYAEELAAEAELQAALPNARTLAQDGFVAPLASYVRTSHFGETSALWESMHTGEDFAAPTGTPLVAIGDAVVTSVGDSGSYGLRTILTLSNGTELWYCHQTTAVVKPGQQVKAGQPIGAVGATGNTTGPHLHLEVRPSGGDPIDPVAWFAVLGIVV